MYLCPKCGRYGIEWDGRARILICCYKACNEVIRIQQKDIPTEKQIIETIEKIIQEETDSNILDQEQAACI